jgi:hypothetical protein
LLFVPPTRCGASRVGRSSSLSWLVVVCSARCGASAARRHRRGWLCGLLWRVVVVVVGCCFCACDSLWRGTLSSSWLVDGLVVARPVLAARRRRCRVVGCCVR